MKEGRNEDYLTKQIKNIDKCKKKSYKLYMKKDKLKFWTIRIQDADSFRSLFDFSINNKHLKIYAKITSVFLFLFVSALFLSAFNRIHLNDYYKLVAERDNLINNINIIDKNLNDIYRTAGVIDSIDKVCRMVGELKPIPDGEREMGIGGPVMPGQIDRDIVDSYSGKAISTVEEKLSQLERKLKLDNSSLSSIKSVLSLKRDVINRTPSILPACGKITSGFGWRVHPILLKKEFHRGLDIANKDGTPVRATADGVVTVAFRGNYFGYGNFIKINHGYGYETRYGHLMRVLVHRGEFVRKGQIIGLMGDSGISTGTHLHYEIRVLGKAVNPLNYILGS